MKKISIALLLVTLCAFIACDNRDENGSTDANNTNSSKRVTDSTRGDKPGYSSGQMSGTPLSQQSIDFAMKAASAGIMEVQLGQMALQKAEGQRVKNFGTMMVTDHGKANAELKAIAASNGITLPATLLMEHQKHVNMLTKMTGDAFDKHYMSMMVNDHKKDIGEFQKQGNNAVNDAIKAFATNTLPVLQKHLDSAQAINGNR